MMKNKLFIFMMLLPLPAMADAASSPQCALNDNFWLTPRSGAEVQASQEMAPCIHALLDDAHINLIITYPDNDEAAVEVTELRQWLIALALPAQRIFTQKQPANTTILLETHHD